MFTLETPGSVETDGAEYPEDEGGRFAGGSGYSGLRRVAPPWGSAGNDGEGSTGPRGGGAPGGGPCTRLLYEPTTGVGVEPKVVAGVYGDGSVAYGLDVPSEDVADVILLPLGGDSESRDSMSLLISTLATLRCRLNNCLACSD